MRLPPRGVCRLCLGGFLVDSTKALCFARFSPTTRRFGVFVFQCFLLLFFGSVFAKVSQIPCFSCFVCSILGSVAKFVWKAAKTRGFCMVDVWKVKHPPPPTTAPHHRRSTKEKESTSRIRMVVMTAPPPPPPLHRTRT